MKDAPIVSIVTPSYNQGEFIEETIQSVISQEGAFYIDYIIMDGGSKDASVDIIKKYDRLLREGKWPIKCRGIEYRWVSGKDGGQVDAIEKGFALAKGDIGVWLNSDDYYIDTHVLNRVVREFQADPAIDVLAGDGLLVDRVGGKIGPHRVAEIDFRELLYLDYHILQPATFMKKSIYKKEMLDRHYFCCFDAEYFIRLIKAGKNFKKISSDLACFRIYPEIKTVANADKRYKESLEIAKLYGNNRLLYMFSVFYKYWLVVLLSRHPENQFVRRTANIIRRIAYTAMPRKAVPNAW